MALSRLTLTARARYVDRTIGILCQEASDTHVPCSRRSRPSSPSIGRQVPILPVSTALARLQPLTPMTAAFGKSDHRWGPFEQEDRRNGEAYDPSTEPAENVDAP